MTREEAIRRIKAWNLDADDMEVLSEVIPELKESQDESIRQSIVETIKQCTDILGPKNQKRMLAWLEKQKESPKSADSIPSDCVSDAKCENRSPKHNISVDEIAQDYIDGVKEYNPKPTWDLMQTAVCYGYHYREQKEQIPYIDFVIKPHKGDDTNPYDMSVSEAQDYATNRGFDIPFNDGEVYVDERHITQTVGNILRWADEHPKEQKPITINQDEKEFLADEITAFLCNYDKEFDGEDPVPSEVAEHFYLLGKQAQEQKPAEGLEARLRKL